MYLVTLVLIFFGTILGQLPLYFILLFKASSLGVSQDEIAEMAESLDFHAIGIGQNFGLALVLLAFVGGLLGLWFSLVFIHKRQFRSLITPFQKINWRKIFFAFGLWTALTVVMEVVFYAIHPENYSLDFEPQRFFGLLVVTLILFPLQTSFEELVFRGYLMQGISLVSRFRWVPLVITSAAFGLMHLMNEEVTAFGIGTTMTYYIGTGLFLGILTLMDDSLELALGIHAATNIYSALFVTFDESSIKTAAVFHMKSVNMAEMLTAFFVAAAIFTFLVAKKNGWKDWSRCFGLVQRPPIDAVERF